MKSLICEDADDCNGLVRIRKTANQAYITNYYIKGDAVSLFDENWQGKRIRKSNEKNAHKLSDFNTIKNINYTY